jgi:signal transduction histidine kinase
VAGTAARYDLAVEELVYRTAQEALANVRKHARPSAITVTLAERSGNIVGEVEDDGTGFDLVDVRTRPSAPLHLGLDTMVERVRAVGGDVLVESAPGEGTRVRFAVPTRFPAPVAPPG